MNIKKILLIPLLFILFSGFLSYQEVILYGTLQAKGQILILLKARPIATDLDDADYPDSLKLRIQQIKVYSKKIDLSQAQIEREYLEKEGVRCEN